jgi:hypothetical protein
MNFITFARLLTGKQKYLFNNRNLLRGAVLAASHYNGKPHAVGLRAYRPQLPFAKLNSSYGGAGNSIEYSIYGRGMLGVAAVFANSDGSQNNYQIVEENRFKRIFEENTNKKEEIWAYKDYVSYAKSLKDFESRVVSVEDSFLELERKFKHLPLLKCSCLYMALEQLRHVKKELRELQKILKNKSMVIKLCGKEVRNRFDKLMQQVADQINNLDVQIEGAEKLLDDQFAMTTKADTKTRGIMIKIVQNTTKNPFYSGLVSGVVGVAATGTVLYFTGYYVSPWIWVPVSFGGGFSFGYLGDYAYLMLYDYNSLEKFKKEHPWQNQVSTIIVTLTLTYLVARGVEEVGSENLVDYLGMTPESAKKIIEIAKDIKENLGADSIKHLVDSGIFKHFPGLKKLLDKCIASYNKSCESFETYIAIDDMPVTKPGPR